LCDCPNDLELPFSADEVIAAMPKDATALMGLGVIEAMRASPELLLSSRFTEELIEGLTSEVHAGGSTLLLTSRHEVVRYKPKAILLMRRQDGRLFARMSPAGRADGDQTATCNLPGLMQKAGEYPDGCLQRLLEGSLRPLADSINVLG